MATLAYDIFTKLQEQKYPVTMDDEFDFVVWTEVQPIFKLPVAVCRVLEFPDHLDIQLELGKFSTRHEPYLIIIHLGAFPDMELPTNVFAAEYKETSDNTFHQFEVPQTDKEKVIHIIHSFPFESKSQVKKRLQQTGVSYKRSSDIIEELKALDIVTEFIEPTEGRPRTRLALLEDTE